MRNSSSDQSESAQERELTELRAEREEARIAATQVSQRAEAAQRFFFESTPMPVLVFDAQSSRILAGNAAALELYGYSREEFLLLSIADLRMPEEHAPISAALDASGSGDVIATARHRRKDGSVLYVEVHSHLTSFAGHDARVVLIQDHTGRLLAEAAQRESEGRLSRTIDALMEGYTILGHDLRYLYVNEVGARQARLPKERLIGHTPMELYPDFEHSGMYALLTRCLREQTPIRMEEELTLADGSKAYFEVHVQPAAEGLVILSVDTTERQRTAHAREALQEQLRHAQRMDAVGRLAGGIAHDFNNLLSIILGYGESILSDLSPADPLHGDVQEMHKAAERAAELTKRLLQFSRQQVVEPKILDLNEVIGGVEKLVRRMLGEQLEFVSLLEPALGHVRADRSSIEQVIMNLVVNARDAMPEGGTLTIETHNVWLDENFASTHFSITPGPHVLLSVTDTGVGMEESTRLRAFEPFFSTKPLGKGTGLGLSTVFGIVQQSGGGIWVYSEPGRGTSFKIYLPRDEVEQSARPSQVSLARGSETVLLVEDEEAVRNVAQRILERNGYRVIVAAGALEALELAERLGDGFDMLLTDVVMPRMGGVELARRLHLSRPGLKVLYMSGFTDGSISSLESLESGASFLQKPFSSELLARKVRALLDGQLD